MNVSISTFAEWSIDKRRAQSLDGTSGQVLLVVPVESRCRSDQALVHQCIAPQGLEGSNSDDVMSQEHDFSHKIEQLEKVCPTAQNLEPGHSQSEVISACSVGKPDCSGIILKPSNEEATPCTEEFVVIGNMSKKSDEDRSPAPPDSGNVTTDEDYFSSYTSSAGMFQPIDAEVIQSNEGLSSKQQHLYDNASLGNSTSSQDRLEKEPHPSIDLSETSTCNTLINIVSEVSRNEHIAKGRHINNLAKKETSSHQEINSFTSKNKNTIS